MLTLKVVTNKACPKTRATRQPLEVSRADPKGCHGQSLSQNTCNTSATERERAFLETVTGKG